MRPNRPKSAPDHQENRMCECAGSDMVLLCNVSNCFDGFVGDTRWTFLRSRGRWSCVLARRSAVRDDTLPVIAQNLNLGNSFFLRGASTTRFVGG